MTGYLGSKAVSGAYQKIISWMPAHDTYIETHLGGGAVMLRKPAARQSYGIDIDPVTIANFWQGNRDFHDAAGVSLKIQVADCVEWLKRFDFATAGEVLIYADPPYLLETRTGSQRYRFEYDVNDHVRLLECLRELPARVMLSGYPSPFYDSALPGWHARNFQVMTRGGVRTERLWMNFDPDRVPRFSGAFAGDDYEDRRRNKRKASRWRAKFEACSLAERLAIMAALADVDYRDNSES